MRSVALPLSLFAIAGGLAFAASPTPHDPIVDDTGSPHATLRSIPVSAVKMGPGFWEERRKINVERSLPTMLEQEVKNGWLDNFLRLEGKSAPRKGPVYTDSDIYKWQEAVAWVLASTPQPWPANVVRLKADFDRLTDVVVKAQEPSGISILTTRMSRNQSGFRRCTARMSFTALAICCRLRSRTIA